MLDYPIKSSYKQELQELARQNQNKKKKQQLEEALSDDSDEIFTFIAGYTSGGVCYGLTWEDWNEIESVEVEITRPPLTQSFVFYTYLSHYEIHSKCVI